MSAPLETEKPRDDSRPAPFVPPEVDLRGYEYLPLYGARLRDSDFNSSATDAEYRARLNLLWSAWQQIPASSLPNDDVALCKLADLGRDTKTWKKVKPKALQDFALCTDNRWYHPFLAVLALSAFDARSKARARGIAGASKRWGSRSSAPTNGKDGKGEDTIGQGTKALSGEAPDDEFEVAWKALPKRSGNNSMRAALKAWRARLREGVKPAAMIEGAKRYYEFCEATGKIGTEYVKQGATFFGPDRHFEQDFTLPATPMNGTPPWYLSAREIEARGRARGFEVPTLSGDFPAFRQQVYAAEGITPEMVDAARKDFP